MGLRMDVPRMIFLLAVLLISQNLFPISVNALEKDGDHHRPKPMHDDEDDFAELNNEDEPEVHEEPVEVREGTDFGGFGGGAANLNAGKLQFAFCVSGGYRQAFEEFARILREKYPNVQIEGGTYPPSGWKSMVAQIFGILKIGLIVAIVSGRDPFQMLGFATPNIYTWATQNKLSSCMMLFLLGNTVETSLIATGAFEVYFNEQLVWSKLESGRIPSPGELAQIMDSQFEMTGSKTETFAFEG